MQKEQTYKITGKSGSKIYFEGKTYTMLSKNCFWELTEDNVKELQINNPHVTIELNKERNKISPSAKRLFLKSQGITSLFKLKEFFTIFEGMTKEIQDRQIKNYDIEQYSAFCWMRNKWKEGKFSKLAELFNPAEKEILKDIQITNEDIWKACHMVNIAVPEGKIIVKDKDGNVEEERIYIKYYGLTTPIYVKYPELITILDLKNNSDRVSDEKLREITNSTLNPGGNINNFNSTRHKANPETTNYSSPEKITKTTSEGFRRVYEVEQPKFTQSETIPDQFQFAGEVYGEKYWKFDNKPLFNLNFESEDTKSAGKKETEGKLPLELDFDFVKQMAERMNSNKSNGKYSPFNWKSDMDVRLLSEALMRHCIEVIEGRYEDDGRSYGHLEALATGAMMINWQLKEKQRKSHEFFISDLVDKK